MPSVAPDATPTPNAAEISPAPTPDDQLHFTGKERRQNNDDGSWIIWQEYQFGKDGPTIWLDRARGKPTRTES